MSWMWLIIFMLGSSAVCAEPPADAPHPELSVLESFVGSWLFETEKQVGFSARQECRWILNKQFLEIDTQVLLPGHPPSSWRMLITYDKADACYRQWKFSDDGTVSTAHGTWDDDTSTLTLSGRASSGNHEESRIALIEDNMMVFAVREFLDDKRTRMSVVRFTLNRVPAAEERQPTE